MIATCSPSAMVSSTPASAWTGWSPTTKVRRMSVSSITEPAAWLAAKRPGAGRPPTRRLPAWLRPPPPPVALPPGLGSRFWVPTSAPGLISGRSSVVTMTSPSARPLATSVQFQFLRPISMSRDASLPVFDHQDLVALEQRRGRDAQRVLVGLEHDLDVGRGAGLERRRQRLVVELDVDLDRAVLRLDVEHEGRDADDRAPERVAAMGVDRHAAAQARGGAARRRPRPSAR